MILKREVCVKHISMGVFSRLFNVNYRVEKLKQNPEKAEKSVKFAVKSIIESILLLVISFFLINIVIRLFTIGTTSKLAIIGNIFVIMLAVAIPFYCLYLPIDALINAIAQMRVNKKKIGWISLLISILSAIAAVVIIICMFNRV